MIDSKKILLRAKWVLEAKKSEKQTFINLASELGINSATFRTMRHRNKVPFKEILMFCQKYGVDANWLFFNDSYQNNCIKRS